MCVRPRRPGLERRGSCPRTFEQIVDELAAVLAHVAPAERYVLVGHSFGSFVVRAYAARHPGSVAGLVLVDPPTEWLTMTPAARPHAAGWAAVVPDRRAARATWRRPRVPGPLDRRCTGRTTAVRQDLWSHGRANARAAGRRSAEASARRSPDRAGALVSAEVLSRHGGSLVGARTRRIVDGRVDPAARHSGHRDLQRRSAAGADRRAPDAGRAFS